LKTRVNISTILLATLLMLQTASGQLIGEIFSGSLRTGSMPNSVIVSIKPNANFTGKFTNIQFTLQLPNTISPQPDAAISNNFLSNYLPTAEYITRTTNESGFYNYLFNINTYQSPAYQFISGVQIDLVEISFTNEPLGVVAYSRLGHLSEGGSVNNQMALYTEISGNDNTDYTNLFYGTGASNHGNYSGYSFVPVQNIVVPLSFISLTVVKQSDQALITWNVSNQKDDVLFYELERSTDGINFEKIATANPDRSHSYQYTDKQLLVLSAAKNIYYRIKETNADNRYKYSDIKSIKIDVTEFVSLFPVPAENELNISVYAQSSFKSAVDIIDAEGRIALQFHHDFIKGNNTFKIDISKLEKGSYFIKIRSTNKSGLKFIKM